MAKRYIGIRPWFDGHLWAFRYFVPVGRLSFYFLEVCHG